MAKIGNTSELAWDVEPVGRRLRLEDFGGVAVERALRNDPTSAREIEEMRAAKRPTRSSAPI